MSSVVEGSVQKAVLLSIKPEYYERIRRGEKTIELRRRFPNLVAGTLALVYASAPMSAVVCTMVVEEILRSTPDELWRLVHERAGVTRDEFERYYVGAVEANGLVVDEIRTIRPISLLELRALWPSFSPPQSFRYVLVRSGSNGLRVGLPDAESWVGVQEIDI